jgi:hypothetical protein
MLSREPSLDEPECAYCHDSEKTLIENRPCGHRWLCKGCTKLYRQKGKKCPAPDCGKPSEVAYESIVYPKLTCAVCYEEWRGTHVLQCSSDCDHMICVGCLVQHVRTSFDNPLNFEGGGLKCQAPECTAHMSFANFNTLKSVSEKLPHPLITEALSQTPLTDEEAQNYDRITKEMMVPSQRRLYCINNTCPGQDDGSPFTQDIGEFRTNSKFQCGYCDTSMCVDCNSDGAPEPWHEGETCPQAAARRSTGLNDNLMETARLTRLTTKKCPSCSFAVSHWHGHACHHIAPITGCPGCGTHYCYSCETTSDNNQGHCGSNPRCSLFCNDHDIVNNIDITSGWPVDRRCGCQMCPDCRPGVGCPACSRGGRGCVVCKGLVPPGSMAAINASETAETARGVLRERRLSSVNEATQPRRRGRHAENRAEPRRNVARVRHIIDRPDHEDRPDPRAPGLGGTIGACGFLCYFAWIAYENWDSPKTCYAMLLVALFVVTLYLDNLGKSWKLPGQSGCLQSVGTCLVGLPSYVMLLGVFWWVNCFYGGNQNLAEVVGDWSSKHWYAMLLFPLLFSIESLERLANRWKRPGQSECLQSLGTRLLGFTRVSKILLLILVTFSIVFAYIGYPKWPSLDFGNAYHIRRTK